MIFNAIIIQETRWSVKKHVAIQLVCAESWITENICPLQFQLYANAINKQSLIRPIKQRPSFCGEIAWGQFNVPGNKHFTDQPLHVSDFAVQETGSRCVLMHYYGVAPFHLVFKKGSNPKQWHGGTEWPNVWICGANFKCERLLETWHFGELNIIINNLWHSEQLFVGELSSGSATQFFNYLFWFFNIFSIIYWLLSWVATQFFKSVSFPPQT